MVRCVPLLALLLLLQATWSAEEQSFDLQVAHRESIMYPGESRAIKVPLRLQGSGSVTDVSSNCGFLAPSPTEGAIDDGEPFFINAMLTASKDYQDGEMLAALFVRVKLPVEEKIVRIDITSPLASPLRWPLIRSGYELLADGPFSDGIIGKIRIARGAHPLQFTDVSARFLEGSIPDMTVSAIESDGDGAWIITCKTIDELRFGALQGILEVRPLSGEPDIGFTTSRRIKYLIPGPVRAARNAVALGTIPLLGKRQGTVGLYKSEPRKDDAPFPVALTSSDPLRLKGRITTDGEGKSDWQVIYDFYALEPVGTASAFLEVTLNNGRTMRLRFYAHISEEAEVIINPSSGSDF